MIYIVAGVSGSGKTTLGQKLATKLSLPFYDADDYHPDSNIEKLNAGIELTDEDRLPWLQLLALEIKVWHKDQGAVLACSALKESYRKILQSVPEQDMVWIFLVGDKQVILQRLLNRKNHFFNPELLDSQIRTYEVPKYGVHIDINENIDSSLQKIMKMEMTKSQLGLVGLGVMGASLARNIADKGFQLSVYNRTVPGKEEDIAKNFVNTYTGLSLQGFDKLEEFIDSIQTPRKIVLMVNAGAAVTHVINDLTKLLEPGDTIIDCGNSHYPDTEARAKKLAQESINYLGVGVSGGEEGALRGPSIMIGGEKNVYESVAPVFDAIAAKDKLTRPCSTLVGPGGAGHYTKMVHNGIEYAEMQLIAEVYFLMRYYLKFSPAEIRKEMQRWQQTEARSYLLDITIQILDTYDGKQLVLDLILDHASSKGTGGWTINAATESGSPVSTIAEALMARFISKKLVTRKLAADSYVNDSTVKVSISGETIGSAYALARIINHSIGFDMLQTASTEFNWHLKLAEIARIWTNGCIIKSELMDKLSQIDFHQLPHLLLAPPIVDTVKDSENNLRKLVAKAINIGCPVPVLSAAINYFLQLKTINSSANLIQAQRDYFGAHMFERIDQPRGQLFHWKW